MCIGEHLTVRGIGCKPSEPGNVRGKTACRSFGEKCSEKRLPWPKVLAILHATFHGALTWAMCPEKPLRKIARRNRWHLLRKTRYCIQYFVLACFCAWKKCLDAHLGSTVVPMGIQSKMVAKCKVPDGAFCPAQHNVPTLCT